MTILNRVKELRARFNFSQSVLAEKVGVTRQTIAAIEKGDYVPSLLLALTICDVFELKMEDVFVLNKEGKRMNRLVFSYMLNVLLMVLAGWAFIELYYFTIEVANFIQTKRIPFEVSVSLMPIGLLLIFGIVSTVLYKIQKKNIKSYHIDVSTIISSRRRAGKGDYRKGLSYYIYVTMVRVALCGWFLTLSPIANLYVPAYPVYIAFSIFFIQMTIFHVSLYRNKIVKRNLLASARRFLSAYTCTYSNIILSF